MEGNSGLCGTIAIWISRRSNTYDPRNHWLTSWWLFLPHSDCDFVSRMLVRTLWHLKEQTNLIPQRVVHGTIIKIIWTIFPSVILMLIENLKKRILNVSSSFYFLQLKYPYWIFFFKISIFVFLVFLRIILPLGLLFPHLACPSTFFFL